MLRSKADIPGRRRPSGTDQQPPQFTPSHQEPPSLDANG
jgi:hypothetical protein